MALTYWIERYLTTRLGDKKQQGLYHSFIRLIKRYERLRQHIDKNDSFTLNIDTMTAQDLRDLEEYIRNEYDYKMKYPMLYKGVRDSAIRGNRGGNYISGIMGRLRTAFLWTMKQGATDNRPFDRYEMPRLVYGTPYYLTLEERNLIYNMDLSESPVLALFRNVFMFQCLIGCRYSDLIRLTAENIVDGAVEYVPSKTRERNGKTVRVPLNEKAKVILDRLLNKPYKTMTLVPHRSLAIYNEAIRILLTKAGITRMVTVLAPKTHEELQRPINEIASSHMARRVFVGNLYKQVKDPNLIASMSGHSNDSRSFARYRAIDDDMKRELVNMID